MPKIILVGAATVALFPVIANASFVLDTGTPSNSTAPFVLSASQFIAGEFTATAGDDITSLAAYLTTGGGGSIGDTFTFDIYSNSGFIGTRSSNRAAPVFTTTGNFTANGWNSSSVNWIPLTSGSYWLALQVGTSANSKGLDAPLEASTGTGTAPALAFAYTTSATGAYAASTGFPIGLQITDAAPVPLPASVLLLSGGLLAGGAMVGRRRRREILPG